MTDYAVRDQYINEILELLGPQSSFKISSNGYRIRFCFNRDAKFKSEPDGSVSGGLLVAGYIHGPFEIERDYGTTGINPPLKKMRDKDMGLEIEFACRSDVFEKKVYHFFEEEVKKGNYILGELGNFFKYTKSTNVVISELTCLEKVCCEK